MIAVVFRFAYRARPETVFQLQVQVNRPTNRTGFRGWIEAVDPLNAHRFVFQHAPEHTPSAGADRLGELVVFEHPADVEVFQTDGLIRRCQFGTPLVEIVLALVGDVFCLTSQHNPRLAPIGAAFDLP